jgi:hypothetical protein
MTRRSPLSIVLSTLVTMVPAETAAADCMQQFPKWHSEQNAEYEACRQRANDGRVGKYFCYIQHMVGIQYPLKDGEPDTEQQPFVGKIRPATDKFVAVLSKNDPNLCESPDELQKQVCADVNKMGWRYLGQYKLRITESYRSFSGYSESPYKFYSGDGSFYLYGDNSFVSLQSFGSQYLATGKCEKIA